MLSSLNDSTAHGNPDLSLEVHLRPLKVMDRGTNNLSISEFRNQNVENANIEQGRSRSAQSENLQSWNNPRRNAFRVPAIYYSFFVFGLNDGAYGALLPYLETYYNLSYTAVSLIFLSPLIGYTIAALLNSTIHTRFGQRGIAVLANCSHVAAYAVISSHPPYPTIVVMYAIAGFGYGLIDGGWNAWTGSLKDANAVQSLLSSSYSLGATVSPILATSIAGKHGWGWHFFYTFMTGFSSLSLIMLCLAFWDKNGSVYQNENRKESGSRDSRTKEAFKHKITWIGAVYFFIYFGTQISLAGWIISFMLRVRHASRKTSGISATGFQAGQTVGRAALGLVTNRLSVFGLSLRLIMSISLACAIALQLVFWLVPDLIVSAVAVAFLGFFLGPLFPAGVLMVMKLLPSHLHVSSIGIATAVGGTGGAVFPFAIGAIAQARGVEVLQPVILALLLGIMGLWLGFPSKSKRRA